MITHTTCSFCKLGQEKKYFHLKACFKEQGILFTLRVSDPVCTYIPKHTFEDKKFGNHLTAGIDTLKSIKQPPKYFDLAAGLLSRLLSTHHEREGQVPNPFQIRGKLSPTVSIQKYFTLPKLAPDIFKERNFCSEQASEVSLLQNIKGNWDNSFWLFTLICHKIYIDTTEPIKSDIFLSIGVGVDCNRRTEKYGVLLALFLKSQVM